MFEQAKKRLSDKLKSIENTITERALDFLFNKEASVIKKRLELIQTFFEPALSGLKGDEETLEHVCKEVTDIKKMQEQLQKMHLKQLEQTSKAAKLISQDDINDEL